MSYGSALHAALAAGAEAASTCSTVPPCARRTQSGRASDSDSGSGVLAGRATCGGSGGGGRGCGLRGGGVVGGHRDAGECTGSILPDAVGEAVSLPLLALAKMDPEWLA